MKRMIVTIATLSLLTVACGKKEATQETPAEVKTAQTVETTTATDSSEAKKCDTEVKAKCDSLKASGESCDSTKCDSLKTACHKKEMSVDSATAASTDSTKEKHGAECNH